MNGRTGPAVPAPLVLAGVVVQLVVVLLVVTGVGRPTPSLPRSSPAAGGAGVDPTDHRCRGVVITPEDDARDVMRDHPPGTTYCLAAGRHRLTRPLVPESGDVVWGLPGATLDGSRVLTGWRPVAGGWQVDADLPHTPSHEGTCRPEVTTCRITQDVFLDGARLEPVPTPDGVGPGAYFADFSEGTVTIGSDPSGRTVEQAVSPGLVRSDASDVTVRNLVIEKAANPAQVAAVDSRATFPRSGSGWLVEHNLVRLNHGVGIGVGDDALVSANVVRAQGQLGVAVWGTGARVLDNEIADNGTAGYDPDWEAGGVKSWMTQDAVLAGNRVHGNRGPGLWSDGGCDDTTYEDNVVTDNWGAGIQHEISYDALIIDNRVLRNGTRHKGWAWEAGIQVQSSGGVGLIEVTGNVLVDNANGVVVIESSDRRREEPMPRGPHVVRNVLVHHNTVTMSGDQSTGVFQDIGDHAVFGRRVRFVANTYRVQSTAQRHFAWKDDHLTWSEWLGPGVGQDRGGVLLRRDDAVVP